MTYLLYEPANAHDGKPERVEALITALAPHPHRPRGIKFHPIGADALSLPDFSFYDVYRVLEFDDATWARLIGLAHEKIGDVFLEMADARCVSVLAQNLDKVAGVKFQASMVDNREVLEAFAALDTARLTVIVNVAGYPLDEVYEVVARMKAVTRGRMVLQAGFQGFPTKLDDTLLGKIAVLKAAFPALEVAFTDHLSPDDPFVLTAPVLAAAMGAVLIEKHVCVERATTTYDRASALEPAEMLRLEEDLARLKRVIGDRYVAAPEKAYLDKTLVKPIAARPLAPGETVRRDIVKFRRSGRAGASLAEIEAAQARGFVLGHAIAEGAPIRLDEMRPAKVGVLVACRMKSSRLKAKATLPIAGVPSIERCLENALMMQDAAVVALCTSTVEEDAVLADYTLGGKVLFHRGDADDVVRRYLDVCDAEGIDTVMRVTGDCPVISPECAAFLLAEHRKRGADLTRARKEAVGTAPHIISVAAMRRLMDLAGGAPASEYMNLYFENNPKHFAVEIVDLPAELIRDYRLTLDYAEDLAMFDALFAELNARGYEPRLPKIFEILDARPDLVAMNKDMVLTYKVDPGLIEELKRKTTLPDGV